MKVFHYDRTPCPEDCPCVFRKGERDAKEVERLRAALVHARDELRRARDTDIGRRLLFHTIDPALTHINAALGEPDEHERE